MFKFLVVEDEKYAREHVAAMIDELNGGGVLVAENGAVALSLIEREHIDAVITDIQMPVMDGIELLGCLHRLRERPVQAILSGHDEFAYVQAAMEYATVDYVLKPVDRQSIAKLYYKMLKKIRALRNMNQEIANLSLQSSRIRPFIKQRFMLDLIVGDVDADKLREMRKYLNLNLGDRPLRVCLMEVDERESALGGGAEESKFRLYNLQEIISRTAEDWRGVDYFDVSNEMAALIWSPEGGVEDATEFLQGVYELINEMGNLYGAVFSAALSGPAVSADCMAQAYEEARKLLRYKLIYGPGQIFDPSYFSRTTVRTEALPEPTRIVEAVWRGETDTALALLKAAFKTIHKDAAHYSVNTVNLYFQKLLTDGLVILERECAEGVDGLNRRMGFNCLEFRFSECGQGAVQAFFERLIPQMCELISQNRVNERKQIVAQVKQYIAQHYAEHISVEALSKQFHFSKNYFGQMFKADTGMNINEYINLHRIQYAKTLLLQNRYKMYEVANMVGYSDQQYFSKMFKRIVGCMPSEYC